MGQSDQFMIALQPTKREGDTGEVALRFQKCEEVGVNFILVRGTEAM